MNVFFALLLITSEVFIQHPDIAECPTPGPITCETNNCTISKDMNLFFRKKTVAKKAEPEKITLEEFLGSRTFAENLDKDFSDSSYYHVQKGDGNKYSFQLGDESIQFGKLSDDGTAGKLNDDRYAIITVVSGDPKNFHRHGVMSQLNNNVLIPPFFFSVIFYKEFNVFVCSTISRNGDDQRNGMYNCFYFDTRGRFLGQDKSYYNPQPPRFSYSGTPSQELIEISALPEQHSLERLVNPRLLVIRNRDFKMGLIDNTGKEVLPCNNDKIFLEDYNEIALVARQGIVYKVNLTTGEWLGTSADAITDARNGFVRMKRGNKWTITDENGNSAVPGYYDYIEYNYTPDRFTIFSGNYNWMINDVDEEAFTAMVGTSYFLLGEYLGTPDYGKWGIVDNHGAVIIPTTYDWIEELSEDLYLLNSGGKLFNYYDQEIDELLFFIVDGSYSICNRDGEQIQQVSDSEVNALNQKYKQLNPKDFYKNAGQHAIRIRS